MKFNRVRFPNLVASSSESNLKNQILPLNTAHVQGAAAKHQDEVGEPAVRVRLLVELPPHLRGQRHREGQPQGQGLTHCWKVDCF